MRVTAEKSKLHNKFKEISMKNAALLDSDSNTTTMRNENHVEYTQSTNSKMPAETNSSLTSA